jgi:hypothetical protein
MANNLTGECEAALQVSVRQLKGLLATLHQNVAKGSGLLPNFPHSVGNSRVGKVPKYLEPKIIQFQQWLGSEVKTLQFSGGAPVTGIELADTAPPGAATRFHTALKDLSSLWTDVVTGGAVRGRVEVQISIPVLSLEPRTSNVVISVVIRARFVPDPGSAALPDPIHGKLTITYQVRPGTMPDGKRVLTIEVPAQDHHIVFYDLAGLTAADLDSLRASVRDAVRNQFKPEAIELPSDFQFFAEIAAVRRQHEITFTLIHDDEQRIGRLYGVHCWPTTLSINPQGIVDRIQFGALPTQRGDNSGRTRL